MTLKTSQLRAIEWYARAYNLKPTLSTPPTIYFIDQNGKELARGIIIIMAEYKKAKKEQNK